MPPPDGAPGKPQSASRLAIVDLLRVVAALSVMWYHFGFRTRSELVRSTSHWGFVGVQVYFVVSGFIIPWALARGGFSWPRDGGRFILKRTLRLDPPYLVASAIAALLIWLEWRYLGSVGPEPTFPWTTTLAHLGYLNGVLRLGWYNGNCWTLGIECQFYLAAAALLPLILSPSPVVQIGFHAIGLAASLAAVDLVTGPAAVHSPWLLQWLPLFLMGIAAFERVSGLITTPALVCTVSAAGIVAAATGSPAGAFAGALASLAIASLSVPHHPAIMAAASLTYSFYLLHEPIGSRAVSLVSRCGSGPLVDAAALAAGIGSSLVAAWLLFVLVERPALAWASRIRYSQANAPPPSVFLPSGAD